MFFSVTWKYSRCRWRGYWCIYLLWIFLMQLGQTVPNLIKKTVGTLVVWKQQWWFYLIQYLSFYEVMKNYLEKYLHLLGHILVFFFFLISSDLFWIKSMESMAHELHEFWCNVMFLHLYAFVCQNAIWY